MNRGQVLDIDDDDETKHLVSELPGRSAQRPTQEASMQQQDAVNRPVLYSTKTAGAQAAVETPAFQFSVLTCVYKHATKVIYPDDEIPYSNVKHFLFKYCEIDTLDDFAKLALTWLADQPTRFIIRGQLKPGFTGVQRRLLYPKDNDPATIECPPRRWLPLDLDRVEVPCGLAAPDKVAEAGYFIRDKMLPPEFRSVRCVASATASTGRKGSIARLRLFFALDEPVENSVLYHWVEALSRRRGDLGVDPSVIVAHQPIYTARPIFREMTDPVPVWGRVRLLDGIKDELALNLPNKSKAKERNGQQQFQLPGVVVCNDCPPDLLDVTARDAGLGIGPIEEISDRAFAAIKEIFEAFDGSPKNGIGRHSALNAGAYQLARLVAECELPAAKAREAYYEAAKHIDNSDGKYGGELIERHWKDAYCDVVRR